MRNTVDASAPLSARSILMGGHDASTASESFRAMLEENGIIREVLDPSRLSGAAARSVEREVAAAVSGVLDIDLSTVLVTGWRKHAALVAAAGRTLSAEGTVEVVDLSPHTVEAHYEPRVEISVNEAPVAHLAIRLEVTFELVGVAATVSAGSIVSLSGGQCIVTARLELSGVHLALRRQSFDLDALVDVGFGIPLIEVPSEELRDGGWATEP